MYKVWQGKPLQKLKFTMTAMKKTQLHNDSYEKKL